MIRSTPRPILNHPVQVLKSGGVIAIPTETVYGLAASIFSEAALQKIFAIKSRPFFDPLIVHISDLAELPDVIDFRAWNSICDSLARAFWPGPLTIVLPKNNSLSSLITSGLSTVAVRMPGHPLALELIRQTGPLAAPSANLFGRISPTRADHVRREFADQVEVIDGGPCKVGIESTILKVDDDGLTILRPGMTRPEMIEQVLLSAQCKFRWIESRQATNESAGQLEHHYQPTKPLWVIKQDGFANAVLQIEHPALFTLSEKVQVAARELYAKMREHDESEFINLVVTLTPAQLESAWSPILDRLKKASTHWLV